MKPLCIYHGNCADGFTAAWVVRRALGDVEFYAGVYQQPPPPTADRDVVIVDFSYKHDVMQGIVWNARSVTILDHHKTAAADLAGFDGAAKVVFDMERSGCRIAWDYYFPDKSPPPLLLHVEDRDLWRFALPLTREIQASVFSYPYDFGTWDWLMTVPLSILATEGTAIERKHFKDIKELVGVMQRPLTIGGYVVPAASLPYTLTSDAGELMARGQPFAACYWDTPNGRVFSLRSSDAGLDVSEIAKQYGGGGHRNASGFSVPMSRIGEFEVGITQT